MYIGCANIRNFPDMTPAKVRADGKRMGELTTLWGQQENDPGEDNPQVAGALGDGWAVAHQTTNLPVWYREDIYRVTGARVLDMPFKPVLPLTPRPRLVTGTTFVIRARPNVPRFVIVNVHFIAGAYNGDLAEADHRRRQRQWDIEWIQLQEFIGDYKRKGRTVFVMGDFNHPRPPRPTSNFMWLCGERLDRIGVTRTGATEVEELDSGVVELNSDHNGQWTRVIVSAGERA